MNLKLTALLLLLLTGGSLYGQTGDFAPQQTASNPLQIRVADGTIGGGVLGTFQFKARNVTLTASATNYVFLDLSQNPPALTVNTTGFPTTQVYQIATVATNASQITSLTDSRPSFNSTISGGGISALNYATPNLTSDFFAGSSLNANWTTYLNSITVSGGVATGSNATQLNTAALTGVNSVNSAQYMTVVVGTIGTVSAALRISGTPTTNVSFYACTETSTILEIQKVVGAANGNTGTNTVLTSATITALAGDRITFSIVGSDMTCQRNGSSNVPLQVHDTSLTTGFPGISTFQNVGTLTSAVFTNPACPTTAAECIVADGDSITAANGNGSNNTDPYTTYLQVPATNTFVSNLGVSSKCVGVVCSTFDSMLTTGTSVTDTLCKTGGKNIVVIMGGTNDIAIGSRTAAQAYADLTTYVTNRHAAAGCNWKVVIVPQVSRANGAATDQSIQALNALIYANTAGADAVVDLPATLRVNGASGNAALFNTDNIHPTELAHINIIAKAVSQQITKF
jgi:GDSL-like Lipase/Acylhydrolase family